MQENHHGIDGRGARQIILLAAMTILFVLTGLSLTETAMAADPYEEYQELVRAIEEQDPYRQRQLYRIDAAGNKITGICNACSITTLLNRRLAYDGKDEKSFYIYNVFDACGVTVKQGPRTWDGSQGEDTGFVYDGDTGFWSRLKYTNADGTTYQAVRIAAEDVGAYVRQYGSFANYLIRLLHEHPEGVCIRNHTANHVAVLYRYEIRGGMVQFYVKDPVKKYSGRLEGSWIYNANGVHSLYNGLDCIVYLEGSKPAPAPDRFPTHTALKEGMSGEDVKEMQTMLLTVMDVKLTADGSFGEGTLKAVKRFQEDQGLTADGMCGIGTWDRLTEEYRKRTEFNRVLWDANGGSAFVRYRSVGYCHAVGTLPVAQRKGFVFDGWYTAPVGGTRIDSDTLIRKKTTFYAHWTDSPLVKGQ